MFFLFMPEKFRGRVIFLPEEYQPAIIYTKHKKKIQQLEDKINNEQDKFIKNLLPYFPKVNSLNILISPSLYGSMGSFVVEREKIIVMPRYNHGDYWITKIDN